MTSTGPTDSSSSGRPGGRGWWNLPCWNGLSSDQQRRLIEVGTLEIFFEAEGECQYGAAIAIETQLDAAPGPRFYCIACAKAYLEEWSNQF